MNSNFPAFGMFIGPAPLTRILAGRIIYTGMSLPLNWRLKSVPVGFLESPTRGPTNQPTYLSVLNSIYIVLVLSPTTDKCVVGLMYQ